MQSYSRNNKFDEIKKLTLNFEKHILDNCKTDFDFKSLIDDLTVYSDYTLLNTLLVKYQYPNFLSLGTKKYFKENNVKINNNAKPIRILTPVNDEYVVIKKDNQEVIKKVDELNKDELNKYHDKDNQDIVFHHKDFKGLNSIELYDVKDTNMDKSDYNQGPLPALFYSSYDEIYNSFVKAIYTAGYKIKYVDMKDKIYLDKDNKIISLKKGINNRTHLLLLLDTYTTDISSNKMEKDILDMVISRRIGIDKEDIDYDTFNKWYKEHDIKDVDKLLKLVINKGRKFANNFNRFYEKELENNKDLYESEEKGLYDDFYFSI